MCKWDVEREQIGDEGCQGMALHRMRGRKGDATCKMDVAFHGTVSQGSQNSVLSY